MPFHAAWVATLIFVRRPSSSNVRAMAAGVSFGGMAPAARGLNQAALGGIRLVVVVIVVVVVVVVVSVVSVLVVVV